ncbi:MAG: hypothetical protein SLAVMIC_00703 [uncultured marine phage]|uniref:Uncharacterized protein n=1 Tax=uncultured marine phage TaxID=707152 RepID=A0A8D9FQF8_9VIRU|nr:MAG: hypothetical protein SLAVMIC_00703 [uncultured marine phage]
MNTDKAQKYLYKQILKSLKQKSWTILKKNDEMSIGNGETKTAGDLINVGSNRFKLFNEELNLYIDYNFDKSIIKEFLNEDYTIFRFNPETSSYLKYWYYDENEEVGWNKYKTESIHLDLPWWRKNRLKKYFKKYITEIYETRYQKTFAHSMDRYMNRNKAIMRDQRLDQILKGEGSGSKSKQETETT